MNNKLDELPKGLAQSVTRRLALKRFGLCLAATAALTHSASGQFSQLGPLVEVSLPNPLAGCNDRFVLQGNMTANDSCEPSIAVNPANPSNIAAIWTGF